MNYDLIALDLDGTLVAHGERISAAARDAVADATAAGIKVVPSTGRAWREAADVLRDLPGLDVGVFSSGAVVANFRTGEVLNTASFDALLALRLVETLRDLPHAVLVFQDARETGRDFLIAGAGELTDHTRGWFEEKNLTIERIAEPTVHDLRQSLRVGVVAAGTAAHDAEAAVTDRFGDKVNAHLLAGLAVAGRQDDVPVYLLEVFPAGTHKWRGLAWLANHLNVSTARVAAIGDELNDLAMLRDAGLGIAMGQASETVKAVAKRETRSCEDDGVAFAIVNILAGEW